MTTLEELAARQADTTAEIRHIQTNLRKEPLPRRTKELYTSRLKTLDQLWDDFECTDNKIRAEYGEELAHSYFSSGYYETGLQSYQAIRSDILSRLDSLQRNKATTAAQQELATAKGIEAANSLPTESQHKGAVPKQPGTAGNSNSSGVEGLIRRQQAAMEGLDRALHGTLDTTIHRSREFCHVKIRSIERYWDEIQSLHNQVYEQSPDPALNGYDIQRFFDLEEGMQQRLVELYELSNQHQQPVTTSNDAGALSNGLKLPKIVLPKFDGDYMQWRQFRDLFNELVHNQRIAKCQKIFFLKMSLIGDAERLIRHLAPTESNYDAAWKIVNDRYENKQVLVTAVLNKLMSQPAVNIESASAIRALHDTTQECLLALNGLEVDTASWDPILMHILVKKLDKNTHASWEQSLQQPRLLQPLKNFLGFLEIRFQSLESLGGKSALVNGTNKRLLSQKSLTTISREGASTKCRICYKEPHQPFACSKFLQMTPAQRLAVVKGSKSCFNCLKDGHTSSKCPARGCKICEKKHNTLLHLQQVNVQTTGSPVNSSTSVAALCPKAVRLSNTPQDNFSLTTVGTDARKSYVFLSTVVVKLVSKTGAAIRCRAILDSGSQINIMTERMMRKLEIPTTRCPMVVQGVGQSRRDTHRRANIKVLSNVTDFSTRMEAIVIPQIVSLQPSQSFDISTWQVPGNIKLADPNFHKPGCIDLLIGAEYYHQLLCIGQIKLGRELPLLQNTLLGWVVTGKIGGTSTQTATCGIYTEDESLEQSIERFWETEKLPESNSKQTLAEQQCEELFHQTVNRDDTGRFIVRLPFSEDPDKLGASMDIALSRFYALERKLARDDDLRQQYTAFMNEYLELGHMQEVDFNSVRNPHYFVPHHSVIKPDSSTTKLRVVFDASSKTSSNISLNDIMYAGPTIQDELFTILLRFRTPRFVIKADIQKMYRQIFLHQEDRRFHLIWWRSDSNLPVKCYQLNTVTYGTRSAPYLATKCLKKLAQDHVTAYPLGSEVLQRDFYVDDVMTGANSLAMARDIQTQLAALLQEGGFKLRKWCSNHQQLLKDVSLEDQEITFDEDNNEGSVKTLGLSWLPKSDLFCIKTNCIPHKRFTKRSIASDIARLFDPLGIAAPVVIVAKLFLQELWELKYDWDAALPVEMYSRWCKFRDGLQYLERIRIPRHVFAQCVPTSVQFHTFADASEKAYGAAVYVRSVSKDGTIAVRLLCSKSRVAPVSKTSSGINSLTMPRLELCAALLAAEISNRISTDLKIEGATSHLWTDSQIVLSWINSKAESFQVFVGRRIAAIQRLTNSIQWRHVRSQENPADVLSRGITPEKLKDHSLWFYGPRFLHGKESIWPQPFKNDNPCDTEKKKTSLSITTDKPSNFLEGISHSHSFRKLQNVTAYCLRFIRLMRTGSCHKRVTSNNHIGKKSSPCPCPLAAKELDDARRFILRYIQECEFMTDIVRLRKYQELDKKSQLLGLAVFLDQEGLLRVGGRLEASNISYDAKHPVLLPYSHPFVKILMADIHNENLHVGPQGLLAITRQRFWPIKGKNIARSIVQQCTRCSRAKPRMYSQIMGNLPAHRVQPARPFINCGVDFCGPIWIHYRSRGSRPQKSYLSIFCCFSTKAVHIEVVSDLSTDAFIGALKRFIGRRGHCRNLYCDNATNFVGARNQLSELQASIYSNQAQNKISTTCNSRGIDFHFIPPRAPHFGGLWEAAVKSAKTLLQQKISSASLTYEELCTVSVEAEAILNSRPITALSNDPNDFAALTPGHFLIGEPLRAVVDPHAEPSRGNLSTRWKLVSHIKEEFWKRWSREYLNELQHRNKWKNSSKNVQIDTVVIIKEDNTPVMKWPLGRIIKVYHGDDGHVRVADVRTKSGVLRRPIHKLAPLIKEENSAQEPQVLPRDRQDVLNQERKRAHSSEIDANNSEVLSRAKDQPTNRKRNRPIFANPMQVTLLLVCLLLPVIFGKGVEVTNFSASPGIHFEKLGNVNLMTNKWNLIVYYDLKPYRREIKALGNCTAILQHICQQIQLKSLCHQVTHQIQLVYEEIKEENELLTATLNPRRRKRGALNVTLLIHFLAFLIPSMPKKCLKISKKYTPMRITY